MERYTRNCNTLSASENEALKDIRICVIGCGGIGGYVIEMLGRLGIGYITAVDGDVFCESNLNRQILSNSETLGKSKAIVAKQRMQLVNPLIEVNAIPQMLDEKNSISILAGHDLIIDALDNVASRLLLQDKAEKEGIPFVHGAVAGWYAQITTVYPGDRTLDYIYKNKTGPGIEKQLGCPSFIPALAASIEVAEAIKIITKKGDVLRKRILSINLLNHEYEIINL